MHSASYFISPNELWNLVGTPRAPQIVDTRRRQVYDSAPGLIPGANWRDIADIERWSHEGLRCSFDTMLKLFGLEDEPALNRLALIVRGADTARPDLAPEAAGLHAVSLGLSALAGDDHGLLRHGFMVYDALFAYIRFAAQERHNWPAKVA